MDGLVDNKAWNCLTKEEQQSLSLSISYGKSSWEVGEIMGIVHYKYLELKERSERLFRLFHDFFELHDNIFKPVRCVDQRFVDYIEACIERRVTRKQASDPFGDAAMYVAPIKTQFLIKQMVLLKESTDPWDIDTYKLIMEFDRWNNWRILPRKIQQPSAYKRRNNRRDIFYIKYICSLDSEQVQNLIDQYWYSRKKQCYYFVVFDYDRFDDGYQIVPVKKRDSTLEKLSKLYIYVFDDKDMADVYGYLVVEFQYGNKTAKKGQVFWPNYRQTIEKAVNYNSVNNLDFYAEKLDYAYQNNDKQKLLNFEKREKKKRKGLQRANENSFYI